MAEKKRILIVEDEEDLVDSMTTFLEAWGYEVLVAYDGKEGLEKARKELPNLIITDVMMPGMDGYNMCRLLKFDDAFRSIPIIMLTSRTQQSDRETGEQVGADVYITKPFNVSDVLNHVKGLLGEK